MLKEIKYKEIRNSKYPTLSDLIFGKFFDYKYAQETRIQDLTIQFHIEIYKNIQGYVNYISPELNKNEKFLNEDFNNYKDLEEELEKLQENSFIKEDYESHTWIICAGRRYPEGYDYFIKVILKKEIEIEASLVSLKVKLHKK